MLGCQSTKNSEAVEGFVFDQIKKQPNGTVNFDQIKSFSWNKLYIVQPYVNEDRLDKTLLKYKDQILGTGIRQSDSFCIIILFSNEKLVAMTIFKFDVCNFGNVAKNDPEQKVSFYNRQEAVFNYTTSKNGYCTFTKHI